MESRSTRNLTSDVPSLLIWIGSVVFIAILAISAYWDSDIRWLHFIQAWMYLILLFPKMRISKWGYFVGLSIAGLWDYTSLFVNNFAVSGVLQVISLVQTGQLEHADQLIAVPGWLANLSIIVGSAWGYFRLREKALHDIWQLVLVFVLATAFFAFDMFLFQPRYLSLFPRMLHPHLPF